MTKNEYFETKGLKIEKAIKRQAEKRLEFSQRNYMTLISITQGALFAFLLGLIANSVDPALISAINCRMIIRFLICACLIIHIWNEYQIATSLYKWVPGLIDIIIPFTLASIQAMLQALTFSTFPSLSDGPVFIHMVTALSLVGWLSYWNLYFRINKNRQANSFTFKNAVKEKEFILPYVVVCVFSILIISILNDYFKWDKAFYIEIYILVILISLMLLREGLNYTFQKNKMVIS